MFAKTCSVILSRVPAASQRLQENILGRNIYSSITRPLHFSLPPSEDYRRQYRDNSSESQIFIKCFLETKTLLTVKDENDAGHNIVRFAALQGRKDVLEYLHLLETGKLDISGRDKSGKTALMLAAQEGQLNVVQYLIETHKGAFSLGDIDADGNNALMLASREGRKDVVAFLLANAQDEIEINKKNHLGQNILMLAAGQGHISVVQHLLTHYSHSIHLTAKDNDGISAMEATNNLYIKELLHEARREQKSRQYLSHGYNGSSYLCRP